MSSPLVAVGIMVVGAIVVLLLVGPISSRPNLAPLVGVPFAVVAALASLQVPQPLGLAIAALCAIACIALLLLPMLDAEVPAHVAEAAALLLLATSGAIALASATDLLQAVVGLETLALSSVTLVALSAGERPLEAGFKYFTLGAISVAGLLYGLGLIYLGTGAFAFPTAVQISSSPVVLAGVVMVGMGFAFELALFPFHWGALDAYTASSASLAGFVMSASKLAAAYALGRLVVGAGVELGQLLIWVGSLTIVWGTVGALAQAANLRRMLGYSAITHAGFIGLALGSGPNGPATAAFYAVLYASMAMLVFAALSGGPQGEIRQMGRWRALALALGLFSLAGIPPTPGFWGKLAVLVVAWQAAGPLPTLIAVIGGVSSVLYYLRPLPDLLAAIRGGEVETQRVPLPGVLLATVLVVVLGLAPGVVWSLAHSA
jgi:NADH-quinone oxidoreductase subunit N